MGISKDIYIGEEEYYMGSDMQPEFLEVPPSNPLPYAVVNIAYHINKVNPSEGTTFRQESFYGKQALQEFLANLEIEDSMSSIMISFI